MAPTLPSGHDRAIAAIRTMHRLRFAGWYPGGARVSDPPHRSDGYAPPGYAITDLDHDERAIRSWPERQPFGWIVNPCGTYMARADHRRCTFGAMVARALGSRDVGFYTWTGYALDAHATAEEFDAAVTALGAEAPARRAGEMAVRW